MIASSLVGALDVLWNARRRAASLSLLPSRTPYARVKRSIFALARRARLAERIDVYSLNAIGLRLYKAHVGQATIASREVVREAASAVSGHKFGQHFLLTEWEQVVDAWQLENWRLTDVARLGRKTRLPEAQRKVLWSIFERVRTGLQLRRLDRLSCGRLAHDEGFDVGAKFRKIFGPGKTGIALGRRVDDALRHRRVHGLVAACQTKIRSPSWPKAPMRVMQRAPTCVGRSGRQQ